VFDVARGLALIAASVAAVRARSVIAAVGALSVGYVYLLQIVEGFTARSRGALALPHAFTLLLLGPSALPRAAQNGWPLSGWVAAQPMASQLATAAISGVSARMLSWRSAHLRPETESARRLDSASLRLTLLMCIDLILATMWLLVGALMHD
jgi:hypothetical protein